MITDGLLWKTIGKYSLCVATLALYLIVYK